MTVTPRKEEHACTCCVVEFCDDSSRGRFEMPPASKTLAKFMAGFFVGFCTNLVICIYVDIQAIENRDNLETLCAKLKGKKDETEEDFQGELNAQIPEPYRPRDMYDLLRYEYMDHRFMYGNFDDEPKIKLLGHQKNDMKGILSQTVTLFKHRNPGDWKFRKVVEMYRRLDPQRGEEYSLTLNLSRITAGQDSNKLYRLSVVKPFSTAQLIAQQPIDLAMRLYMIVPIFNATEKFHKFLLRFEEICIKKKSATVLVVVSFLAHTDKESETDKVASLVQRLSDKYGNRYFRYIHTYQPFSRGLAIDIATNSIPDDKLLFFCDVDIMFSSEFLDRCRTNAVFHQQVFYPVVFSQYQPEFVKAYSPDAESADLGDINRSTGHWVHYGYGVACMFAGDYRLVGGFDRKLRGWGGEDVNLFSKHVTSQLKIFRAMDPGLIHIYHRKTCDPDKLSANQYRMCEDSRAQAFGSRQQLAKHLVAKGC